MKLYVTGGAGFIGQSICDDISQQYEVNRDRHDLTNHVEIADLCTLHHFDVIIHCAGIAHQKVGSLDRKTYFKVNSQATENLAICAAMANPDVKFFFLSSVSVYGERAQHQPPYGVGSMDEEVNDGGVTEDDPCHPSGDYADSKLDAEHRLIKLYKKGVLKHLDILRLAPVYDKDWSLNLDRRVFAPKKTFYVRFGSGMQRMSALARPNLVAFICHLLGHEPPERIRIFNVCDADPYSFSSIIDAFKKSGVHPVRLSISIPMVAVWLVSRIAGKISRKNRYWWYACYDKLASDLVYDNQRMLETGFRPQYSLKMIFSKK